MRPSTLTRPEPAGDPAGGPAGSPPGLLGRLARTLAHRRRATFLLVTLVALGAAFLGSGAKDRLSAGGYTSPTFESQRADQMLAEKFHAGAPNVVLVATAEDGADAADATASGRALTERIAGLSGVVYARSYWTTGDTTLRSDDGHSGLVLVRLAGDDNTVDHAAHDLVPDWEGRQGALDVRATGQARVYQEADHQGEQDLRRAEMITAPLTLVILLAAFGSLVAASLPVLVGVLSVLSTLAVLRLLTSVMSVSVFGLNITTALGFGLAVDYSLFVVTRYREELAAGRDVLDAVVASMRTAGRTVLFSALTVVLSFSALLVFPVYFLRSISLAGISVVTLAAVNSMIVLPPLLFLIGRRIDRFDVFGPLRRRLPSARGGGGGGAWHRLALAVMRRPAAVGLAVAALLVALALPFTKAHFALADDRVLPRDNPAQVAAQMVREQFPGAQATPVLVVAPELDATDGELADYARRLSALPHTVRVDSAAGSFARGQQQAPPTAASAAFRSSDGGTWLSIVTDTEADSAEAEQYVRDVRALDAPDKVLVGGYSATLVDTLGMMGDRIPWAALIIVASTLVLLFLFTGSVVIPVKQLVLNALSLTASLGAMVYVFQDGHLKWLVGDFIHSGHLEVTVLVMMFCVAFGLSMDYSVFLLSRIREEYRATGDNTRAVAFGMQRTGRLISIAALIIAVVLGAVTSSHVTILKLLGTGLAVAVLVDATLVRGLLVPAAMRLLGRANWWAPAPLRRLHARIGLRET